MDYFGQPECLGLLNSYTCTSIHLSMVRLPVTVDYVQLNTGNTYVVPSRQHQHSDNFFKSINNEVSSTFLRNKYSSRACTRSILFSKKYLGSAKKKIAIFKSAYTVRYILLNATWLTWKYLRTRILTAHPWALQHIVFHTIAHATYASQLTSASSWLATRSFGFKPNSEQRFDYKIYIIQHAEIYKLQ